MFRRNKFLRHKITQKKAANGVLSKNAGDFEKIVAVAKSKGLKRYAKNS